MDEADVVPAARLLPARIHPQQAPGRRGAIAGLYHTVSGFAAALPDAIAVRLRNARSRWGDHSSPDGLGTHQTATKSFYIDITSSRSTK